MGGDYVYPSIYFAYFLFAITTGLSFYFLLRSRRDGYWGSQSEEIKYRMLEDVGQPIQAADPLSSGSSRLKAGSGQECPPHKTKV